MNRSFDGTKSFEDNFDDFLKALTDVDEDMAAILRANVPALKAIVRDGERDANARAAFNAAITAALDGLAAAADSKPEGG